MWRGHCWRETRGPWWDRARPLIQPSEKEGQVGDFPGGNICKLGAKGEPGESSGQREGENGKCEGLLVADRERKVWLRSSVKQDPGLPGRLSRWDGG